MNVVPASLRRRFHGRLRGLLVIVASAFLTNCSLDELLSPTAIGTLTVSEVALADTARVGSTAPRTTTIELRIVGATPTLKYGVTSELGSAWITGGLGLGTAPNDLTITLDPSGLAVGDYVDTLRFSNDGPDARLIRVPISLTILPCAVTDLASIPATATSALTAEDCAATGAGDRFAKRFRFTGTANDSVSVRVGPSAFAARVSLRRAGAIPTLATSENCPAVGDGACVRYVRLTETGAYEVEVTSAAPRVSGTFDVSITRPRAPASPSAMSQRSASDLNATIAAGSTLSTDRIALQAALSDLDSDSLRLEIELRPLATAFTNTATTATALSRTTPITTTVTGLSDNTPYHWQARTVDQTGRASAWIAFGTSTADFSIGVPEAPSAPTLLIQRRADGITPIATGGTTTEPIIRLGATVSDPDPADQLRLEFEVRTVGTAFQSVATQSSAPNPSGSALLTSVAGLVDNGQYRWQARTVDQTGRTSAWVSLGGAGAHFRTALPPASLLFDQQPISVNAGSAITPAVRVAVRDASGATLLSYNGAVTIALATNPTSATLGGTTTVSAVSGLASFTNLSVDRAGTGYTLRATVGTIEQTSTDFAVSSSAADRMELGAVPISVTAGATIAPALQVLVKDALGNIATGFTGNVTLALTPNVAGAELLGTTTVAAVAGIATFTNVRIEVVASDLTLLVTAAGLANITSAAITVMPAAPTTIHYLTAPSTSAASGEPLAQQPVMEIDDSFGNNVITAGITVSATIASGPVGALLVNGTVSTDVLGRATFSALAIVGPSGSYTLTFSAGALTSPPTSAITIGAGAATQLAMTVAPPASAVNGEIFTATPRARLRDAASNAVSRAGVAVTVSLTGGGALTGTTTVLTNALGQANFSDLAILGAVGPRTLTFTATGLTSVTSGTITLLAGPATTLTLSGGNAQSAAAASLVPIAPSVIARDVSGNPVSGVAVSFAVTSGGGSVSPTTDVLTDASGIASLTSWTLGASAGANVVTATAGDLDGSPITLTATATAGAASQMVITGGNSLSGTVGTTLETPHEVRITDQTGNPVAGVTVTWQAVGGGAVSPLITVTDADGRARATRTTGNVAGTKTTVASATLAGGPASVTFTINATVGGATQLTLVSGDAQVDSVGATLPLPLVVVARDVMNNPVSGVLISWSVLAGGGSLSAPTSVTDALGRASMTWTLGTVRTATDSTQIARASGVGSPVSFVALARAGRVNATQTNVAVTPTSVAASRTSPATVTVTARDGFGNPVAGVPLTLAAIGSGNTIVQPVALTNANGVATGSIGATITGARTITATVNSVVATTTPTLTIVAAPPAALLFTVSPTDGNADADLTPSPAVGVADSLGNRNLTFTGTVTLALGNNPSAGILAGTLSRTAVAGVATFPGVGIDKSGAGYTLTASSAGLSNATSSAFSLSAGAVSASQSSIGAAPTSIVAGSGASTITVTARDDNGNPIAGATVALASTGSGNTLAQPVGVTDASGVATGTLSASVIGARTISASIDGVPVTATTSVTVIPGTVSPTLSTITGVPSILVAGVQTSAVTVTARDVLGNPISGATVVIAATGSTNTIVQPVAVTNASGVALGSFGSTRAESKTLSATINGIALSSAVTVSVTPGAISAARSLVSASPSSIVAAAGNSTITVTARDANDNVIGGQSVVLAATGAGNTLTQPSGPTDAAGVATGTLSSTASGAKTITATIGGIPITQSAIVTVTPGGISAAQSTVESSSASLAAGDTATITVTARDASGNPVSGGAVVLSATGAGNSITQPAGVTDANGVAVGRFVSTLAQDKVISATAGAVAITQTAPITVTPASPSDTASSVVVAPTTIAADGSSANIAVTVRDRFANAVVGVAVTLAASGTGNALVQPAVVTDAAGVATGSIASSVAGTKLISAAAGALALADTISLTVTPASISAAQSSVSVAPTTLVAGVGSATITVTARDANGNVVPGATVTLAATGTGNTLTQPSAVTDANGVATGTIASTGAGIKTISATIGGTAVTQTASLTVTAASISGTTSTLATSTTTVAAGTGQATLTVTVRDAFGNPVAGAAVVLSATGGGNNLTQPAAVTNAAGIATGTFRSATSESKTITATAGGVALAQSVVVSVVPDNASASTSTVVISSITLVAGTDTATVTVTARDGSGNVVPGVTVVLETVSAGVALIQPVAVTDANGVATGRVTGTMVGAKTITAKLNGVTASTSVVTAITPAAVSADSSLVLAVPQSVVAGTGVTEVFVTARDRFTNLIESATVVLAATGTGNTLTQPTSETGADGRTRGTLASTVASAKIVSATVNGVALNVTDTVAVTAAGVSAAQSTISASLTSVVAGGTASTLTVTARDAFANVISGASVTLSATGTSNTLVQPVAVTNAAGQATGTFTSTLTGTRTISASINSVAVSATQDITVTAAAVSATQSTLGADPSSIVAGGSPSAITVRARDQFGNNVSGVTVLLIASGSSNTVVQPAAVTDADGFATGTLSSTVAEEKAITAIAGGVTLSSGVNVTIAPGAVSAANTTISASPSTLIAGAGSSTLTLTARDANNNLIPGATVILATTGTGSTLTQPAGVTAANGVAAGSFSATTIGPRTISATVNGTPITATASITVNAAAISAAQSSVSVLPTSITAGGSGTTATVTVRDAFNNPISGATVVLASTGTGNTITQPVGTTDANGVATGTIATTVVGQKAISATAGGVALTQVALLDVVPGAISAAQSSVGASALSITAGSGTSTITVTARDANGNVIPNAAVVISATGTGNTITSATGNTDAAGVFTATFSATVSGARTISATVNSVAVTQTAAITVTSAGISAAQSLVAVSPGSLIAGQDTATVTITVRDEFNNPISGVSVSLAATGSNNSFVQPSAVTDANGVTTGRLSSTTAESKVISATAGSTPITQTASVTVTPAAVSAAQSTVSALPTSLTAGTTDSATVTVTARDAFGNVISGATVVLASTGSGNTVVQPSAVTNASGVTIGYVRSTGAGAKTISATINGTAITQTASVAVVAASVSGTTSTIGVSAGTISAGAGTTTVTVTARDAFGNPVAGATIVLAATGDENTLTQPAGLTNAAGVTTGSFRSTASELKTLSATANSVPLAATVNVNVVPDAVSAAQSLVSASLSTIEAGAESSTITVMARDINGNPVPGLSVTLEATGADVVITQPAANTDASGVTTGSITGTIVGTKTVTALLNGVPATTTVNVAVTPSVPSLTETTASATPTTINAGAGSSALSATVRDAFGNVVPGVLVEWSATGTGNAITASATSDVNGVATGSFSSTVVGAKVVTISVGGNALAATITITVIPGAAAAAQSTIAASATNITTDGSSAITVTLRDADGNLLTAGSGTVALSTTLGSLTSVTNLGNGTYTSTLTSTNAGTATVSGTLNAVALANTVDVAVSLGAASVGTSTITAAPTSITTDGSATITVQLRDAAGNNLVASAGTVLLSTSRGSLTAIVDNGNGTYTATLTSTSTGSATITGSLNGTPFTDDATVSIAVGGGSLTTSTITAAASSITTDGLTSITVQLKDAAGNNLTVSGGAIVLNSTRGTLGTVTNNNNGTYTASFSSATVGTAVISGTLAGNALADTAGVTVSVGAASLATSTIASSASSISTDGSATITVQLKDAAGNNLTATGGVVTLATTRGVLTAVTNNNDGTYTATLTSGAIGGATITGALNGNVLAASTALTITIGAASPLTTTISADPTSITTDGSSTITVQLRDAAGNSISTGGSAVSLTSSLGTVGSVSDNGNGTFTASLTSPTAGSATVTGTLNAATISDNAVVTVGVGGASRVTSTITPSASSVTTDGSATITVQLKDAGGNNLLATGGVVSLTSDIGSVGAVADLGNGTYTATFSSPTLGLATIAGTLGGLPFTDIAQVTVNVGAAAAATTTITASPATMTVDGSSTITVQLKDAAGNDLTTSPATILLSSSVGSVGTVANNGNGTYTATLTSAVPGSATIIGTLNGVSISDNAVVAIGVGAVSAAQSTVAISPPSIAADGSSTSSVTVTARDQFGNAISGASVVIAATGTGNAIVQPAATTNASGAATGAISSTVAGTKTVSATAATVAITQTQSLTVTPASVSATTSTVAVGTANIIAGSGTTLVTVTARDANSNLVVGASVTFNATGSDNSFTSVDAVTNSSGVAVATFSSTRAELKSISTIVDGTSITQQAAVTVAPAAAASATSLITTDVATISADVGSVAIAVSLRDAFNNPLGGGTDAVTLSSTLGTIGSVSNNANGTYGATLTVTSTGTATISGIVNSAAVADNALVTVTPGAISAAQSLMSGSPTTLVAGADTSTITVTVRDQFSNPVSGTAVTLSVNGSSNSISIIQPVGTTNSSGQITGRVTSTLAESKLVSATAGSTLLSPTVSLTVNPAAASPLTSQITANPTNVSSDVGSSTITVSLRDQFNNALNASGGAVTLGTSLGSIGTVTNNANGSYTATLTSATAGTALIGGTVNSVAIADSASVTITSGGISSLQSTVLVSDATITAGTQTSTITVTARDASGNPVQGATVVLSASPVTGNTLTQPLATTDASGVATGTLASTAAGVKTITATINGTQVSSQPIVAVTAAVVNAGQSTLTPATAGITAGGSGALLTLTARDQFGNAVPNAAVVFAASGTNVTLTDTLATTNASGVATMTLTATLAGAKVVSATAASVAVTATSTVTVTAGAATQIAVNAGNNQSATVATAVLTPPSVIVRDANNNPVAGVNVTFARGANVGAVTDTVATTNASGIATVGSWTLGTTAGSNTLTATSGSLSGSPVTFTATGTADAAAKLAFTTQPSASTVAGVAFAQQPVVTIQDANNNTVNSNASIALTLTTGSGALNGVATLSATNGVANFSGLSINLIGSDKVLTAASTGLTSATTNAFAIPPAPSSAANTTISVANSSRTADQSTTVTVQLIDQFGNARTTSNGTVVLSSDFGTITGLSDVGDGTWTATFNAGAAGTSTITGTLNATAITDDAVVTVTAGAVSVATSTVSASPTPIAASSGATTSTITVTARDSDNNPVPGVTVVLSSTGTGNTVNQPVSVTIASGQTTGSISSTLAASKTVTATVNAASVTDDATVVVEATTPSPANIQITVNDNAITADETATITVQLIDQFGNLRTTNDGAIVLSADIGSISGLTDNADGTWTATFDGGAAGLSTITGFWSGNPITDNATVTVTAGAASQMSINAGNAQSAIAGDAVAIAPSVLIRDAANNPVAGVSVTFAIVSGAGTLVDSVATSDVNGVATLGSWTLGTTAGANSISATSTGLTNSPLTFAATGTAGNATQMVFVTQPTTTQVNTTISTFVVEARDANGNLDTGFGGDVTVSVQSGSGALTGTVTVTASGGVVSFSNVQADTVQTGLILRAAFPGLTDGTSAAINITL